MAVFSLRPGVIVFSSDWNPAQHATLFGPDGRKLSFRNDQSSFDDGRREYSWAFDWPQALECGQKFIFATGDRVAVGEVLNGGAIIVTGETVGILRDGYGKPVSIKRPPAPGFAAAVRGADEPANLVVSADAPKLVSLGRGTSLVAHKAPSASARILFVNPSVPYNQWACHKTGAMNEASFSSHGMAYVSATLKREGHQCWMVDLRSLNDWPHVATVLAAQEYDVAFVGFLSIDAFNAACVVRLLKEIHPDRPVVVGGLHVSIAKERVFPRADLVDYYCFGNMGIAPDVFKQFLSWRGESTYDGRKFPLADYVILDDGEIAARDLVAELAAGRRPASRTLEGGAVPMEVARHLDRDLFDLNVEAYSPILPFQPTPMVTVTWARGCSYRCTYCNLSSQLSNTNVRTKPVALVEEELDDLHRRFNGRLGSLMIHDDLTFHIRHIAEWCELILRKYGPISIWMQTRSPMIVAWYQHRRDLWELLCRAGLTYVSVGFESGSQRVLDYMKKDATVEENIECGRILDEYGINSFANFLWGTPEEDHDDAEKTVALVQRIRPGFLSGSIYTSYPGTAQDRICRDTGLIVPGEVYTRSHLPWQYRIKGIDYGHLYDCLRRAGESSNYLRMPKMLSEDRKRELSASRRGLPVH